MKLRSLILVTTSLALGGFVRANPVPVEPGPADARLGGEEALHDWEAKEEDNICGITDLKKVSKPALVDYDQLLKATPQIKEINRKGIDPESAEGKALRKGAKSLITKSAELVREAKGHCSVWKVISHKDGRKITDVTDDVIERF